MFEDVRKGIEYSLNKLETIDIAIINAGVSIKQWMKDFKSEEF